jgi:tRNA G18 (ribose-2'-O)-methylase SpoU
MISIGPGRLDRKIARDAADTMQVETHRTIGPVLEKLREEKYRLVGLEQTSNSQDLHQYRFEYRTALVIGNERTGLTEDILKLLDDVVEVPVWGLPYSYNVATATAMCLYEYCRQFPEG